MTTNTYLSVTGALTGYEEKEKIGNVKKEVKSAKSLIFDSVVEPFNRAFQIMLYSLFLLYVQCPRFPVLEPGRSLQIEQYP